MTETDARGQGTGKSTGSGITDGLVDQLMAAAGERGTEMTEPGGFLPELICPASNSWQDLFLFKGGDGRAGSAVLTTRANGTKTKRHNQALHALAHRRILALHAMIRTATLQNPQPATKNYPWPLDTPHRANPRIIE